MIIKLIIIVVFIFFVINSTRLKYQKKGYEESYDKIYKIVSDSGLDDFTKVTLVKIGMELGFEGIEIMELIKEDKNEKK